MFVYSWFAHLSVNGLGRFFVSVSVHSLSALSAFTRFVVSDFFILLTFAGFAIPTPNLFALFTFS